MSFLRPRGVLVALLGGLFLIPACTPQTAVDFGGAGLDLPEVGPPATRFTLLLQSQRSRIIRDDDNQGAVDFTANTSIDATIRWCVQLTGSVNTEECTGDCDIDAVSSLLSITCPGTIESVTSSVLRVTDIISDPGVSGTDIVVFVFATPEGECTEDDGDCTQLFSSSLSVVRPSGSLQASGQSGSGSIANPGEVVRLIVDIEGGDPALFDVDICSDLTPTLDDVVSNGEVTIPATDRPYGVTWSVTAQLSDELSSRFDATSAFQSVLELCNNDGETRTQVDFAIPNGIVGDLTFTIEATDASGITSSTSISLSVESAASLVIGDLSAGLTELLPDQETDVVVALSGGECPYEVTFTLPDTSAGTLKVAANAGCGDEAQENVREIVCTVGAGDLNDCATGGSAAVRYASPQTPATETVTVNVLDAVGATARDTVSIATTPAVSVMVLAGDSTIAPGQNTTVSATISGGQPPYTVRFGASTDAEELVRGTLVGENASCPSGNSVGSPDSTGTATCSDVPAACETVEASDIGTDGTATVVRKYCAAGNKAGNERVTVTVTDALGESDTSVVGFTVAVEVELAVTLVPQKQTLDLGETIILTAEASGGIPPYSFTFQASDGTLSAGAVPNQNNYQAPGVNNAAPTVSVTATDSVGGAAMDSVTLFVNQVAAPTGPLTLNVQNPVAEELCAGDERQIIASASGGAPPFAFVYVCPTCNDTDPNIDPETGTLNTNFNPPVYTAPLAPMGTVVNTLTVSVTDSANVTQNSVIDFTTQTISPSAGITSPVAPVVCDGDTIALDGDTNIAGECTWICGDGSFLPPQPSTQTVYTPGANDIAAGTVDCTMTCLASAPCQTNAVFNATTNILVTTVESPDRTTCVGETILLVPVVADVVEPTCVWTGGNGVFDPNRTTLIGATYDPTDAEEIFGSVQLTLTCDRLAPCAGTQADVMTITFDDNPVAMITLNPSGPNPADPATCEGSSGNLASVDALAPGVNATYAWTVNGGVIASGQNTPQITYSINASPGVDTAQISVTVTNDDTGCVSLGSVNLDVVDPDDCDDNNDCTADSCVAGACVNQNLNSGDMCGSQTVTECDAANTCDGNGNCLDNFANGATECGDLTNTTCNPVDMCDGNGGCTTILAPSMTACDDPTVTQCDGADQCDGAGNCDPNFVAADTDCGDGPTPCSDQDTCDGAGACQVNHKAENASCGNGANNQCTDPDTCDGGGACQDNHIDDTTPCGSGADTACSNPDSCQGGVCDPRDEDVGTFCGDITSDQCTLPDTCDILAICQENHFDDLTPCGSNADTACSNPNSCQDGVCDPRDELEGFACSDGAFCNGAETCNGSGTCDPGAAPNCTGQTSECSDVLGQCVECLSDGDCMGNTPVCIVGTGTCVECIDDGDCGGGTPFCGGNECVECVVDAICDDGNDCTNDTCDAGSCVIVDSDGGDPCDDGTHCDGANGTDTCDGNGACDPGTLPDCGGDVCNETLDICTECEFNSDCAAGEICLGSGTCVECVDDGDCGGGTPFCVANACEECVGDAICDDGNDCTNDTCDAGSCVIVDSDAGDPCDDGTHCDGENGTDTCDGSGSCDPGTPPVCADVCNETLDACTECEINADCAAGETCDAAGTCQP